MSTNEPSPGEPRGPEGASPHDPAGEGASPHDPSADGATPPSEPAPSPWHGQGPGGPARPWREQPGGPPQYGQYGAYDEQATQPVPQPSSGGAGQQPAPPPYGAGQQPDPPRYGQYGAYGEQATQPVPQPQQYGQYGSYGQPAPGPQYGASAPGAQPQYGQHGTYGQQAPGPQYGQYGQYGAGFPQAPPAGFGGAAQPGIVPLRPLNVGEILDGAFRSIRANPKVMFGLSLVVMAVLSVIQAIFVGVFVNQAMPFMSSTATPEELAALGVGSSIGYLAASIAISLASVVLTGLLIISVSQSVLGRVISIHDLWAQAKGQVWRLIGLTVLLGLIGLAVAVVVTVVAVLLIGGVVAAGGSGGGTAVAVLLTLLLVFGAVIFGVFLAVRLGLAAPVLMLERSGVGDSLKRSWALTRQQFWRIFGILALAYIIVGVLNSVLLVPLSVIGALVGPSGALSGTMLVVSSVVSVLISALTTPFLSAVLALVYIDVRMRKEALDVELARAAEAA
ncbi:glycerophosphoryl diester phosphodiesterase membrane domain-containing protein [Georgenia thermotolerans]|uniref:DUF7847 domain-containing protein n=1 Tax=Georgenia thermotolerans TaxID=527326 RepID=A0A7J5UIS9_9MICO|nr:glycerophosphoryl diester phosphodiesterase membrane domain-containing protein [Georgenia thermotolerans]KAE8762191.1 hypothetical protein GB883_20645 [Georgenia thermotolerans]